MKILMVNDQSEFEGGSSQLFLNEILLLKQNGNNVFTFTLGNGGRINNLSKENYVYVEPVDRTLPYFFQKYFSLGLYRSFYKIIITFKPDIIHFHNNLKSTFSFYLALSKFNIPTIHTLHDANLLCISSRGINKFNGNLCLRGSLFACFINRCMPITSFVKHALLWKLRQYYEKNKVDQILCPSMFLKSKLLENGFKNVLSLNNFVKHQGNSVLEKKNYILYCGRLIETKGVMNLIEAFELMMNRNKSTKLIIIGDGYEINKLEKYITKQNMVNRVTLLRHKQNSELNEYYKYASLTILPSIAVENSPMSILESFSYGTPVVASNIGGIPELVKDNLTGMLFKPGDYVDLSSKIEYLLASPKLLKRMSNNCLNVIKLNYTEVDHYKKLMSIYESVLVKNNKHTYVKQ